MPCGGQPVDSCGGGNRIGIYFNRAFGSPVATTSSSAAPSATVPPVAGWVPSVGNFDTPGCYPDSVSTRSLRGDTFVDETMTVEKCIAFAREGSWRYAGVEYGV